MTARRLTDIILAVAALGALAFALERRPTVTAAPVSSPSPVDRGASLVLPGTTWLSRTNVVLVASTTCKACNDSLAFYKHLSELVSDIGDASFIVLSPQPTDMIRSWLDSNNISAAQVTTMTDLPERGFIMTPTVLIIDNSGVVRDIFLGRMSAAQEQAFLARLNAAGSSLAPIDNADYADEIDQRGLAALKASIRPALPTMLDVRDPRKRLQEALPGGVNIPKDELSTRALLELSPTGTIVIECRDPVPSCRVAGRILKGLGFMSVYLLR